MEPTIHTVHEPVTGTWQYIVADPTTREAVIIDSVLDYNKDSGMFGTASADHLMDVVATNNYTITRILETHAHADHLTASRYLQEQLLQHQTIRPLVCIGQGIGQVQETMGAIYSIPDAQMRGAFDHLFADGERFQIGSLVAETIQLPGHTPDSIGYMIGANVFVGDSFFHPDLGTARCDFPGGSATALYSSLRRLLDLPREVKLYTGHDYPPKDRSGASGEALGPVPYTTVAAQSARNKHVKLGTPMEEFVRMRMERDATLSEPKLLRQSMQVNLRGGRVPAGSIDGFNIERRLAGVAIAA